MQFKPETKVLAMIGTGGVGKTTTAAALALGKAYEGYNVLVITIDPSLRLSQTLNFKPNGTIQKIKLEKCNGTLSASTISHAQVFNEFIEKAISKSTTNANLKKDIKNLTKNKLFKQLTSRLSQSQDFTTLFYLYNQANDNKYDYIVLDTPPAQHTWNFLKAPEKIAKLFSDDVNSWFKVFEGDSSSGFFKKIIRSGSYKIVDILQTLTGTEFIQELKSFFNAISAWQKPLNQAVLNCQKILISKNTEFILVSGYEKSRAEEALKLSQKIYNEGYHLTHLIINMVPNWLDEKPNTKNALVESYRKYYKNNLSSTSAQLKSAQDYLKVYKSENLSQDLTLNDLHSLYKNFQQIHE